MIVSEFGNQEGFTKELSMPCFEIKSAVEMRRLGEVVGKQGTPQAHRPV